MFLEPIPEPEIDDAIVEPIVVNAAYYYRVHGLAAAAAAAVFFWAHPAGATLP